MRRRAIVALLLITGVVLTSPAFARWMRQTPEAPGRGGPRTGGFGGAVAEAEPEWLRSLLGEVNRAQRQLNQALSRELRRLREGDVDRAAALVVWIAFLYGVLHAVGPGHGKLVVSSLFLARDVRLRTAIGISGLVSLLQTTSAIAIVSIMALVLGRGGFDVLRDSRRIELVSYGMIVVIGLAMLGGSLHELWVHRRRGSSAEHRAEPRPDGSVQASLVLATGLTPCASAVIILLFALGQGVFLVGVAASLVMAIGMGLTVSLVGLLALAARRGTVRILGGASEGGGWVKDILGVAGAAAITTLGLVLLLASWTSA